MAQRQRIDAQPHLQVRHQPHQQQDGGADRKAVQAQVAAAMQRLLDARLPDLHRARERAAGFSPP
ncbi:hypothetical protein [Variovorax davisae]|uniref:hypothetical protein n=1 Tax=Variovorax davisae TaxID=3053515 RepID=UPI0033659F73